MATGDELNNLSDERVQSLSGQSTQNASSKIRILVVEDDPSTQMLYEKGLFNQIFENKIVASGKEALRIYREWHPEIIMLDIYLPEMSGYHILKEIRQNIGDKETTIVMATSQSRSQDITACMTLGVEGYIVKPFSLRDIGAKIISYYAKKEPDRAQKADAILQEILKEAPIRLLVAKDKP
jgi:DNA-binding response OmpR family regulator